MNLISQVQYLKQANDMIARYDEENGWFRLLEGGLWEKTWLTGQYISVAYECYKKIPHASAEMLLLGDTKIRKESALVSSFSLMSVIDEKDPDVSRLIAEINQKRQEAPAKAPPPFDPVKDRLEKLAPGNPLPVADEGSILSTRGWSPILNDSFIMGGAHANMSFFLALNAEEARTWGSMRAMSVRDLTARYEKMAAGGATRNLDDAEVAKVTWLRFFRENPHMLWDAHAKIPRVFMRELIGLANFGYQPRFSANQLGFLCVDEGKADGATLAKYLDILRKAKFDKADRPTMLQEVGKFLFQDAESLTKAAA